MRTGVLALIVILLFVLALSIGINIGLILEKEPPQTTPTPSTSSKVTSTPSPSTSPTPTVQVNPTPIITPPPRTGSLWDHDVTLTYSEASRQTIGDNITQVAISIHLQYNSGDSVTLNYNEFFLSVQAPRSEIINQKVDDVFPIETGSVTVGSNNRTADFQLTFKFATTYTTFTGLHHFSTYYLVVDGYSIR